MISSKWPILQAPRGGLVWAPADIIQTENAFQAFFGNSHFLHSILDAGCGTGDNALFFASQGHKVTGIDFLEEPIQRAKRKAAVRGVSVTFLVKDTTTLKLRNC